jgi:hypothetical protein
VHKSQSAVKIGKKWRRNFKSIVYIVAVERFDKYELLLVVITCYQTYLVFVGEIIKWL